ncbi:hypothetical protein B0H11DRAFT_1922219 [Mycena galericulata]|nr:hypothetical protein B0H11DRAFT_1922219 [Mycena galericulata]
MPQEILNAENKSLQTRKFTSFRRCEGPLTHELATSNFHHSVNPPESQCLKLPRMENTTSPTHSAMQGSAPGDPLDPLEEHLRRELRKFTAPRLAFPPAPAPAQRCADLYREYPERIKDAVKRAKEYAAESRGAIECELRRCKATVSTEHGALWKHLQDMHGVLEGTRVHCCWTGCSAKIRSTSLVQHLKSVHFDLCLKCPSCPMTFRREDTLKRHLSGQRWVPEQN